MQPLTIGELWAVSITLRTVLIESLRRLVDQMMDDIVERAKADLLADAMLGATGMAELAAAEKAIGPVMSDAVAAH